MATFFNVRVGHQDAVYARQGVAEAFGELGRLERALSRFVEGSDVWRINAASGGGVVRVLPETMECLRIAMRMREETGGAFDVTYGAAAGAGFELDEAEMVVRVVGEGLKVDLGAIGKGFALDRMAKVLGEWEIGEALLCASDSTVLAVGERVWEVEMEGMKRKLSGGAFSGSGKGVLGDHIVDPRTGEKARGWWRCWAGGPSGAEADALSTAFMVMSEGEIRGYCQRHPGTAGYAQESEAKDVMVIAEVRQ